MSFELKGRLLRIAPYFPVADVEQSKDYYVQVLGFKCEYIAGQPSRFAIVSRDDLAIMLRRIQDSSLLVPNEKQGGTWDAFFWVSQVRALHEELVSKGADIVYGPMIQQEYQMEEFAVRDRDGHVLGFGQELPAG